MEFGRIGDDELERVDFALAPWRVHRRRSLDREAEHGATRFAVRIGAPAWGRTHWVGRVYERGTRPADMLTRYARHYDAIELNSSFYGLPSERSIASWIEATPESFRFCAKLPRAISHARDLGADGDLFDECVARLAAFGPRLGPSWLQLPPTFDRASLPTLAAFLARWPRGMPLAIELRAPSWFGGGVCDPSASELVAAFGATLVVTDVAGRRDVAHGSITSRSVFVRFVGNAHATDEARLSAWADRLDEARSHGVEEAWFFVHQPDDVAAPESLSQAARVFASRLGVPVRAWHPDETPSHEPGTDGPTVASSSGTPGERSDGTLPLFR